MWCSQMSITYMKVRILNYVLCLSLPNRAIIVQKALLLQSHALKELTVHVQLSVMSLSAPLVAEASIAAAWVSQSPLEAARRAITAKKEPSQEYDNTYFDIFFRGCYLSILNAFFIFLDPD